jgi:hypothetical protein
MVLCDNIILQHTQIVFSMEMGKPSGCDNSLISRFEFCLVARDIRIREIGFQGIRVKEGFKVMVCFGIVHCIKKPQIAQIITQISTNYLFASLLGIYEIIVLNLIYL